MHPVLAHILARGGKEAPFRDSRRIALVLYGGIMLGVRGAGALRALEEAGAARAFDEVYAMSSGFLNGSYFLSGQVAEALRMYPDVFSGRNFLDRRRIWKVADTDYLVRTVTETHPVDIAAIHRNPARLYAMLINVDARRQEYLEVHDCAPEDYPSIVRAAASLPFVGRGSTRIGGVRYRDIFRDDNLPDLMRRVLKTDATDVLALYNYPWQREYVDRKVGLGGDDPRLLELCLCPEPMSRFETDAEKIRRTGEDARARMRALLESR